MIFTKEFKGVKAGDIYHTDFVPGDECPPELLDAAVICEVVELPTEKADAPTPAPAKRGRKPKAE